MSSFKTAIEVLFELAVFIATVALVRAYFLYW